MKNFQKSTQLMGWTYINRGNQQHHGQSVALLETPNGVTIIGNKPSNGNASTANYNDEHDHSDVEIRNLRQNGNDNENNRDNSFEYATDRESSVYNPTTMPLRSVMAQAGGRNSQKNSENDGPHDQSDLLTKGNQLGIPESRFSRWIPKDQREILEKQAKIMAERMKLKTPETKRSVNTSKDTTSLTASASTAVESDDTSKPMETEI